MSFTDQLVLWLHLGFAIFTVGPLALAISSAPRYIRRREVVILRYLTRMTVVFTIGSLFVLVFGVVLGQLKHDFSHPWLTAAMTLFIVAIVLLVLIIRDERSAIKALTPGGVLLAQPAGQATQPGQGGPATAADAAGAAGGGQDQAGPGTGSAGGGPNTADSVPPQPAVGGATLAAHIASVERGRIAAMGGVVNLIWLVILALMVWRP
jgi:hypothetical protein